MTEVRLEAEAREGVACGAAEAIPARHLFGEGRGEAFLVNGDPESRRASGVAVSPGFALLAPQLQLESATGAVTPSHSMRRPETSVKPVLFPSMGPVKVPPETQAIRPDTLLFAPSRTSPVWLAPKEKDEIRMSVKEWWSPLPSQQRARLLPLRKSRARDCRQRDG